MPRSWSSTTARPTILPRSYSAGWHEHPRLHLVQNPGNRGKGYSVRNGLLQAAGDIVMFTDADLSAPMEEAERLIAAIARRGRCSHRLALAGPQPSDDSSAALSAVLRSLFQLGHPNCYGPAVQRYPVRLQGIQSAPPRRSSSACRPSSVGASTPRFSSSLAS